MPEGPLQPLPGGKLKLGAEHFRKVVRRIECIKPLAGQGVKIQNKENGIEISLDSTSSGGGGGPGALNEIELQVVRNGELETIVVYGPLTS